MLTRNGPEANYIVRPPSWSVFISDWKHGHVSGQSHLTHTDDCFLPVVPLHVRDLSGNCCTCLISLPASSLSIKVRNDLCYSELELKSVSVVEEVFG